MCVCVLEVLKAIGVRKMYTHTCREEGREADKPDKRMEKGNVANVPKNVNIF